MATGCGWRKTSRTSSVRSDAEVGPWGGLAPMGEGFTAPTSLWGEGKEGGEKVDDCADRERTARKRTSAKCERRLKASSDTKWRLLRPDPLWGWAQKLGAKKGRKGRQNSGWACQQSSTVAMLSTCSADSARGWMRLLAGREPSILTDRSSSRVQLLRGGPEGATIGAAMPQLPVLRPDRRPTSRLSARQGFRLEYSSRGEFRSYKRWKNCRG